MALYGNNDNKSSLWINNVKAADIFLPKSTGNMHLWNKAEVGTITFPSAGLNLLTLYYNAGANLGDLLLMLPSLIFLKLILLLAAFY